MKQNETIGAILREYKQKSSATVPDLIPQLCAYAKKILNRPTITPVDNYDMNLLAEPLTQEVA